MSENVRTILLIAILLTSCNKAQEIVKPKQDLAQETIPPPVQPTSATVPEVKPKQDSQQVMQPMSKADTAWKNAGVAHTKVFIVCAASLITSKIFSGQYYPVQLPVPVLVVSTAAQVYFLGSGLYYGAKGVYYSCTENKKDERKD